METRRLGNTDMQVTRLGVGLSEIGSEAVDEARAGEVLGLALDAGVNFLDTAACYGHSEEMIGRTVSWRREAYYLATKCGHVVGGYQGEAWGARTIRDSVERSLKRLNTEYLDLLQLHSCDVAVLERGEAIQALQQAKQEGKTRYIGYSGDNEAAQWAVESGLFDTLQTSFNLVDQQARFGLFEKARERGMGIITKRPIANGAWGANTSPSRYADAYFERAQKMLSAGPVLGAPEDRISLALGFTFAHEEVDVVIVGTKTPEYMRANLATIRNDLPLAPEAVAALRERFERLGRGWPQLR